MQCLSLLCLPETSNFLIGIGRALWTHQDNMYKSADLRFICLRKTSSQKDSIVFHI